RRNPLGRKALPSTRSGVREPPARAPTRLLTRECLHSTNCTPARPKRARFSSEPRRCRLSSTMTRTSGQECLRAIARVDPTKPAPPEINTHSYMGNVEPHLLLLGAVLPVIIAPSKVFFQPQVQDNKQIPTSHLLNFQPGDAGVSVRPANRHHC